MRRKKGVPPLKWRDSAPYPLNRAEVYGIRSLIHSFEEVLKILAARRPLMTVGRLTTMAGRPSKISCTVPLSRDMPRYT